MDKLITEIRMDPPQWIVYQRQMASLAVQEKVFIHGQPSAQRNLDGIIMQKIMSRQWQVVDQRNDPDSDWYFIRTRP